MVDYCALTVNSSLYVERKWHYMATSRTELEQLELIVQQFRVNELHILLSTFKCPKLGKKNELIQRCISLLRTARNQGAIAQKIREISSSRRYMPIRPTSPSTMYGRIDGGSMMANGMTNSNIYGSLSVNSNSSSSYLQPSYSQMDRARNLSISHLPFYDKLYTVLELTELASNISGIRSSARVMYNFCIPMQYVSKLCYRGDATPLPRHELQLRFFYLDPHKEQPDDFPPNCSVKIDDLPVTLPNVIPTNKPNTEPKRPSRPVNITPYCQPPRDPSQRPHRITVEWSADKRSWAVGIFVVNRLTSEILLQRLLSNVNAYRDSGVTKVTIRNRLAGSSDDDGVRMEKLRISLLCPLGKTRMVIPVKPSDCSHLQCFDLSLFLQMNEKRPTWKCGVCNNPAPYNKLIVDGYFQQILKEVDREVHEVELLLDGGWRPVTHHMETISDDEDIPAKVMSNGSANAFRLTAVASAPNFSHAQSSLKNDDSDIITIEDSDDEVEELRDSLNKKNSASTTPATTTTRSTSDQSIVCIDLDDSDVVEPSTADTPILINTPPATQPISPCVAMPSIPCPSAYLPMPSVSAPMRTMVSTTPQLQSQATANPPLIQQMPQYTQQPRAPYYSPNLYGGQHHSNPGYFSMYPSQHQYNAIPPELNARTIEEELRNFMANIQQSTSTYRGYS